MRKEVIINKPFLLAFQKTPCASGPQQIPGCSPKQEPDMDYSHIMPYELLYFLWRLRAVRLRGSVCPDVWGRALSPPASSWETSAVLNRAVEAAQKIVGSSLPTTTNINKSGKRADRIKRDYSLCIHSPHPPLLGRETPLQNHQTEEQLVSCSYQTAEQQ